MKAFFLIISLYSGGDSPVATITQVDRGFETMAQCQAAAKAWEAKGNGNNAFRAVCYGPAYR